MLRAFNNILFKIASEFLDVCNIYFFNHTVTRVLHYKVATNEYLLVTFIIIIVI